MTTDWHTADKDYQAHHMACAQCIAAGANAGRSQRCPTGQALWDTYNQAGMPPFLQPRNASKGTTQ